MTDIILDWLEDNHMSFKGITGPGEYRTRDGRKAVVERRNTNSWHGEAWCGQVGAEDRYWKPDGTHIYGDTHLDIIAHWKEDTVKPTAKDIADIIAKFPKECQQQVTELVKTLGYPTQPEPKAGQVWESHTRFAAKEMRILVENNGCQLVAIDFKGNHKTSSPIDNIRRGDYTFVANSLAEYVANGGKL